MQLERFKNPKFSYPGKGTPLPLDPILNSHGPLGLSAYPWPFGLCFQLGKKLFPRAVGGLGNDWIA